MGKVKKKVKVADEQTEEQKSRKQSSTYGQSSFNRPSPLDDFDKTLTIEFIDALRLKAAIDRGIQDLLSFNMRSKPGKNAALAIRFCTRNNEISLFRGSLSTKNGKVEKK